MICSRCNYSGPFRVCGDGKTDGRLYGRTPAGEVHCDVCCGEEDKARMIETGRATLYLSRHEPEPLGLSGWRLSNWPGTFSIKLLMSPKVGLHNMAGRRYDVWFTGPDGKDWHGVQYGDNTQICHCRRIKG